MNTHLELNYQIVLLVAGIIASFIFVMKACIKKCDKCNIPLDGKGNHMQCSKCKKKYYERYNEYSAK